MSVTKLTSNQSAWFENASEAERKAFMSKGPVEFATYCNIENGSMSYAPTVRGIRVGNRMEDSDKVLEVAEAFFQKLQTESLPVLDERALGIDGECLKQAELCYDKDLRIENVLHLGSLLSTDAFEGRHFDGAMEAFIDTLIDPDLNLEPSMQPLRTDLDDEELDDYGAGNCIAEHLLHKNIQGFALQARRPVFTWHSETSKGFSWGWTRSAWVYGESFEEAFVNAVAWADRMEEFEKNKFLESQKTAKAGN
ncbi:hypothetical protein [Endozoicomonas sp. GU-1]|uniref:hypothetical protein n=1 Tax=Endozoicomonas sp. GU-1 TaxID=3009078 RepID=UPI0022B4345E|nr:hypothetical protein [Endozoicomonas sp. GU-1]WBA86503.1 hypothetical protein O3276_00130 [Endozoicomonas sp. GU-1]